MQKIESFTFKTFKMVLASFQVENMLEKALFFKKTFLLADFSIKMILKILFLTFSNSNIKFALKKLNLKSYTIVKTLSNIKQVKIIDKKNFVKAELD